MKMAECPFPWEIFDAETLSFMTRKLGIKRNLTREEALVFFHATEEKGCTCRVTIFVFIFTDSDFCMNCKSCIVEISRRCAGRPNRARPWSAGVNPG